MFVIAGCGRNENESLYSNVIVEEGIPHLYNPSEPLWGSQYKPLTEEEVLGGPGSPEDAIFSRPCAVEFGHDGSRYVLDQNEARIVRYGPDGRFMGSFGRKGEGPGEFDEPTDLEQLPDGTLVVTDWSGMRISFFSAEGDFIRSFRRQKFSGQVAISRENRINIHEQPRTLGAMGMFVGGMEEEEEVEPLIDVVDSDGEEIGRMGQLVPFEGNLLSAWMNHVYLDFVPGDSLIANFMGNDRIEIYEPGENLVRVVHRNVPFTPIEPVEETDYRDDGVIAMRFEFDILSTGLAVHPDGRYWAVMVAAGEPDRQTGIEEEEMIPQPWALDLYDRMGRWLARQQMDESARHALLDWGPDGLYLISSEGDGTIRRYSVKPPN